MGTSSLSLKRPSLRMKARQKRRRLMLGVFFLLLMGAGAWIVLMTPLFAVRRVAIQGAERIASGALEENIQARIAERPNILLAPLDRWASEMKNQFPELKSVHLTRKVVGWGGWMKGAFMANALTLTVEERRLIGVTCKDTCFAFDEEGVLVQSETVSTSPGLVRDERNVAYALGYQVFTPTEASRLATLARTFPWQEFTLEHIVFRDAETALVTDEGWSIMLDNERSAPEQLVAARIALTEEIKERRSMLEYVDVTIKNRVYYKFRN